MKSELSGLLKRDFYLLYHNGRRRILIVLAVICLINISYICLDDLWYGARGITGMSADEFRQSPSIPYYFILIQFAPTFIIFDFVRRDLFSHSSNIIVKLRRRETYLISKLITEFVLCLFICLITTVTAYSMQNWLAGWDGEELEFYNKALISNFRYNVLCSYIICELYSVVSIMASEVSAFIISIVCLCLGLPGYSRIMIINNFMLKRDADGTSIVFFLITTTFLTIAGFVLLKKVDIFDKKGETL
jgi:hypothetical protein